MQGLHKYVDLRVRGLPQAMRLSDTPCSKHLPQNHVHSQSMALTEVLENESPVKKTTLGSGLLDFEMALDMYKFVLRLKTLTVTSYWSNAYLI